MRVIPGFSVNDMPTPPTLEEDARRLGVPVYALDGPLGAHPAGHSRTGSNGEIFEIAVSFAVLVNPSNTEDPANFITDTARLHSVLDGLKADRPEWFRERLRMGRYPTLWESVVSIRPGDGPDRSLEERLASHINHVALNTLDDRRSAWTDAIPTLDHKVSASHAHPSSLKVDGTVVDAITIDSDPDITGWATATEETIILVAVDRGRVNPDDVALVRLTFDGLERTPV